MSSAKDRRADFDELREKERDSVELKYKQFFDSDTTAYSNLHDMYLMHLAVKFRKDSMVNSGTVTYDVGMKLDSLARLAYSYSVELKPIHGAFIENDINSIINQIDVQSIIESDTKTAKALKELNNFRIQSMPDMYHTGLYAVTDGTIKIYVYRFTDTLDDKFTKTHDFIEVEGFGVIASHDRSFKILTSVITGSDIYPLKVYELVKSVRTTTNYSYTLFGLSMGALLVGRMFPFLNKQLPSKIFLVNPLLIHPKKDLNYTVPTYIVYATERDRVVSFSGIKRPKSKMHQACINNKHVTIIPVSGNLCPKDAHIFGSNHMCIDEILKTAIAKANADKKQSGGAGNICLQFVTNPKELLHELQQKHQTSGQFNHEQNILIEKRIELSSYLQTHVVIQGNNVKIRKIIESFITLFETEHSALFSINIKDIIRGYNVAVAAAAIGVKYNQGGGGGENEEKEKKKKKRDRSDTTAKYIRMREKNQKYEKDIETHTQDLQDIFTKLDTVTEEIQQNLIKSHEMFKQLCDDRKDASTMIPVVIGFAKSIDPFSELYIEENVFKYIINFVISALLICDNSEDMMLSALSACSVPLQSKDSYLVSSTQIVTKLKKTEFSDLVELLLCTIVNKSNPRHQVYNACFLYYVASKKLNKQKIPFIDDLFEPVSNEDVEKIRNESDNFINFIVNKTDNELIGTYDFFDPFLPELLLDEVVPGLILAKMFCHFNEENKQKIIQRVNEKKFICSLESLSKLFYEKKGEAVQNVQKCSPLSSYKVINKEDDDDDAKKLMSYYICSAHGELASEAAKRDAKKSTKNISNDIVPDNVVLIKLGRVGEQVLIDDINNTGDEAAKIQEIQYICSRNLNDLLLRGDTKNSACDVLAPGCALPSMTLRGDASFFSGIYDCTNYDTIEYYDDTQNYLFQDALTRVSEEAYETGHMALLVLIACQITADTGMIALGNIANRYYIRLGRKYTVVSMERNLNFEPESIIQEAYAIRHPPPRTPPVTTPPQQQSSPSSRGGSREISAVPYLIVAVLAAIVNSVT